MPIRFRCVYCNQLLGISRRKAGTIVRCTTCEGQLIVPDPNEGVTEPASDQAVPSPPDKGDGTTSKPDLFEQSDFDALLEPFAAGKSPAAVADPPKPPSSRQRSVTPSPAPTVIEPRPQPAGLVLNRRQVTLISVLFVLGLGLAFAGGLLLGLSLKGG